jgi:hypothetical protein
MIPDEAIDRARQSDIVEVARRYVANLKRVAANEWVGPCPVCGGKDRFAVNTRKQVFNCRGCGAKGGVIKLVMHGGGLTFPEAITTLSGKAAYPAGPTRIVDSSPARDSDDDVCRQHEKARWLWAQRKPLAGSVGETYLRKTRGYGGPLPPTLAFLRAYTDHPPALIAAFALHPGEIEPGVLDEPRDVQAVQLIALSADGSGKANVEVQKRTIGTHKGLPIVVSPPNDLLGLSIHEGVEDALSAYEATNLGCWASGGASFLPGLADAVPSYIEAVTIVGHQDRAGQIGARELARRLAQKGVEVFLKGDDGDG